MQFYHNLWDDVLQENLAWRKSRPLRVPTYIWLFVSQHSHPFGFVMLIAQYVFNDNYSHLPFVNKFCAMFFVAIFENQALLLFIKDRLCADKLKAIITYLPLHFNDKSSASPIKLNL